MTAVAFLGLGRMGAPMAARIAEAGHPLTVYNRTPRPELVPNGASAATTPGEAVAEAEVIVTMVADGPALMAVLDGPDGVLAGAPAGAVLVDMSTIGPEAATEAAARCAAGGVRFLDAPVSGSVPAAQSGALLAMVGGPGDALEVARPVLEAMTARQVHLGPVGAGATMKLALNLMLAVTNETIAETLVITERAGIGREQAYEVLAGGALASPYVGYKREAFADPAAAPVAFSVALMDKDVSLALAMAERLGARAPAGHAAACMLARALDGGLGDTDVVNVLRSLQAPSGD
jgi:3-hydroxyisobutyrate dehydrogenase-like beta-hydroxyacid dehydrogenase